MIISFITTVLNEEESIEKLLISILKQTKYPHEVIVVDGGSSDNTISKVKNKISTFKKRNISLRVILKKGNRSVGRNEGIKQAKGDIILISDAGCILDKKWVEQMVAAFVNKEVDVVAGYYKGKGETILEKSLVPYVLVMPDKVDPDTFLPASRSMAFRKRVWKEIGGFPEEYSHNEDYVFANRLKKKGYKIIFQKKAIVYWLPRRTLKESFNMFFRFAFGDIESGIFRESIFLLYTRYAVVLYLLILTALYKKIIILVALFFGFFLYVFWSIKKNYKYVANKQAILFLPLLQLTADAAVLSGSTFGFVKRIRNGNIKKVIKNNLLLFCILCIYSISVMASITWGTPHESHPFAYQMDEWHSLQSVRFTFKEGSPNIWGAAHGFMFYFFISGIMLIPLMLVGIINPFIIKSPVVDVIMLQRIFIGLRLETLLFGITSIIALSYLCRKNSKTFWYIPLIFFTFSPIWLTLSNLFKYDIAVVCGIILSLISIFYYAKRPTLINFILVGVICALALAIKISNAPLFVIYIFSFFWFTKRKYKHLLVGFLVFIFIFLITAIPDLLLKNKDYGDLLYVTFVSGPASISNYNLGMHYGLYLLLEEIPAMFGHALSILFFLSFIFLLSFLFESYKKGKFFLYKYELFVIISFFLYIGSLIPIGLGAGTNRSLVLLPFVILIMNFALEHSMKYSSRRWKKVILISLCIGLVWQIFESYTWLSVKYAKDPRFISSEWVVEHISPGTLIGIENIPIYQMLPDVVLKEFYLHEYKVLYKGLYRYEVISAQTSRLPKIVIISNSEVEKKLLKKSPKNDLVTRLKKERYVQIAKFKPYFKYYSYVNNEINFTMANLIPMPTSIIIYKKI